MLDMKSIYEEQGGTYLLGEDGMYYPEFAVLERKYKITIAIIMIVIILHVL